MIQASFRALCALNDLRARIDGACSLGGPFDVVCLAGSFAPGPRPPSTRALSVEGSGTFGILPLLSNYAPRKHCASRDFGREKL